MSCTQIIRNSYTIGCPPIRGDNPLALASGLSFVQVDNHGITILYPLHQCRSCTIARFNFVHFTADVNVHLLNFRRSFLYFTCEHVLLL